MATRNSAGLWDVSHMGRLSISGRNATPFLDNVLTNAVNLLPAGRSFYSLICNEEGGIVDDVVTLKISDERYVMVTNASNREKDFYWLSRSSNHFEVDVTDTSDNIGFIAFQGPKAEAILQGMTDVRLSDLRRFHHTEAKIDGLNIIISRTGYTGEDGFEIFVLDCPLGDPAKVERIWNEIILVGATFGVLPCGLGSRDTLRLEAGMCLYGQDIDEHLTPLEAGLESVVKFDKGVFIGKDALLRQKELGISTSRVCFVVKSGVPRNNHGILKNGKNIGHVTSGTFSPILRKGIGIGYVQKAESMVGNRVEISIRGSNIEAELVNPPFYDTRLYGMNRLSSPT